MKIFLILMLACSPAAAEWGRAESAAAAGLAAASEIEIIGGAPLLDLLAARDGGSLPLELAGESFLATVVFDGNWNSWFALKPAAGPGGNAWSGEMLEKGVVYKYKEKEFSISGRGDALVIEADGVRHETSFAALFDRLYAGSMQVSFGGAVTYAVFRNTEPLTEGQGTVSLRRGSDGLYYFSLTPDGLIEDYPRWLLAVNGVLYGLRLDSGSLLFVSKKIDMRREAPVPERRISR